MKRRLSLFLVFLTIAVFSACAHSEPPKLVARTLSRIHTVYVWDADGHIDLALLRGLKAEAGKKMREYGYIVTGDPGAAEAFVKVTVVDAKRDADNKTAFVKARLYIIDSSESAIVYDKTAEARATGGGDDGPEYPVAAVVADLISGLPAAGPK